MANQYNLSLVFYPQPDGQYHVTCPDLPNCFSCGSTMEEARERIYELIGDILSEQISASAEDEEALRLGLCMEGKTYQEVKVTLDESGKVRFPKTRHTSLDTAEKAAIPEQAKEAKYGTTPNAETIAAMEAAEAGIGELVTLEQRQAECNALR